MKKVLVTGGAGFIGRHLVRRLLSDGQMVTVLDDLSSGERSAVPPQARFVRGSVLDEQLVAEEVAGADVVFHLAAVASVTRCITELVYSHEVNVVGFLKIVAAAEKRARSPALVYASSAAVYGARNSPARERDRPAPISPYGAEKLAMEQHAQVAAITYGLGSIGLRFFNVYGPGQNPKSPYSGVISIFADRIKNGKDLIIYGDGKQARDFVYVSDVVQALVNASDRVIPEKSTILNVCTGVNISIRALAEISSKLFSETDIGIRHMDGRPGDIIYSVGDPRLSESMLGCRPNIMLSTGLTHLKGGLL